MPDSCEEKVFPFAAKEISEREVAANVPLSEMGEMDPEDLMVVKFVLRWTVVSNGESPLPTTVLLRTTLTRTIKLHYYMLPPGSNHLQDK